MLPPRVHKAANTRQVTNRNAPEPCVFTKPRSRKQRPLLDPLTVATCNNPNEKRGVLARSLMIDASAEWIRGVANRTSTVGLERWSRGFRPSRTVFTVFTAVTVVFPPNFANAVCMICSKAAPSPRWCWWTARDHSAYLSNVGEITSQSRDCPSPSQTVAGVTMLVRMMTAVKSSQNSKNESVIRFMVMSSCWACEYNQRWKRGSMVSAWLRNQCESVTLNGEKVLKVVTWCWAAGWGDFVFACSKRMQIRCGGRARSQQVTKNKLLVVYEARPVCPDTLFHFSERRPQTWSSVEVPLSSSNDRDVTRSQIDHIVGAAMVEIARVFARSADFAATHRYNGSRLSSDRFFVEIAYWQVSSEF